VVTTASGQQSVDTVNVTIGGKAPTVLPATSSQSPLTPYNTGAIQQAIDKALPGDLIIIPPGDYQEMLIMWKPVRLQGVGAASSIIDANAQPAGKMDPWRRQINCLFGLALNGTPLAAGNPYDPTGTYSCGTAAGWNAFTGVPNNPQVDRLPLEGIVGWDTTTNGNLAQLLSEPTLMGAYEGAVITVVGKGVNPGPGDYFGVANEATYPTGSTNLTAANCATGTGGANPYSSNFQCNPSSIDGLTLTDASEGGGGIFVHAWAHNLQIANNRVYANIGTLSGGINVGQGESPDAYLAGTDLDTDPGSCETSLITNTQLPYCYDLNVNVHNNSVTSNTSIGDELFSGTPAGAGGVSFCTGADYYKFNYNWICGNMSTGDGGGVAHIGFNKNGDIEHNTIIFNQSLNPTIPTNGGGLIVMATAPDGQLAGTPAGGPECGSVTDVDCAPGLGDGTGPGLVINANLIMGNAAEAGSGGGIRFQGVNGTDVPRFPNNPLLWYGVTVTNNIITNNVAGWDGGGVSLQDSLKVNLINNTIASNDSTATAGVLFNTLGAPLASAPGVAQSGQTTSSQTSAPQPAGVVSMANSTNLAAALPGPQPSGGITCPAGHSNCGAFSNPYLANDLIWQNRTYFIGVGTQQQPQFQQNLVTLYNSVFSGGKPSTTGTPLTGQTTTGQCVNGSSYWDIGVRGDTGPGNHASGFTLAPTYSVLTNASENAGTNNITPASVGFTQQYCNGSRVPPELAIAQGGNGGLWNVPPGISDATVPNPIFNLTPAATVDEGNNWINMTWGPLSMVNPVGGAPLGNYALNAGSPAIDHVGPLAVAAEDLVMLANLAPGVPSTDFFGNPRPDVAGTAIDIGAIEYKVPAIAVANVAPTALAFNNVVDGTTSAAQTLTLSNTGGAGLTGITVAVTAPFARAGGTCGTTLAAGATCTITVTFTPAATGSVTGTATIGGNVTVTGSPVSLSGTGVAATHLATVTPSPLAFGNWATGTTSNALTLTVTNTGNSALAGGTFTFGGGTPQPYSRPAGATGGTCGAALAVGASCTINVVFAPTTAGALNRTLTVAYTGATVTPTPASLTGTGSATRATVSISPNPLTITLASGTLSGSGIVTLTNTAAAGGSEVSVTNVAVAGSGLIWAFTAGTNNCTGATLLPGASCTVQVNFTRLGSVGTHTGSITFTDTGAGSPQTGVLTGVAH
jgi:hypothetical protein